MSQNSDPLDILATSLNRLIPIIESQGINYYIHAGVACFLQAGTGDLSDLDIRIQGKMDELGEDLEYRLHNGLVDGFSSLGRINPPIYFSKGYYTNSILQLEGVMDVDIINLMETVCDIGTVVFPPDTEWFQLADTIEFRGRNYKVASCEMLMIYYLLHRRTIAEGKMDEEIIRLLARSPKFQFGMLDSILKQYFIDAVRDRLLRFYDERVNDRKPKIR